MTDALINDKPQFVRLFAENGLNILDYLTYGRLETLYQSVADGTLLYHLLQRRLVERMGTTVFVRTPSTAQDSASKVTAEDMQSGPGSDITLFEVCFFSDSHHCCICLNVLVSNYTCCFSSGCRCPGAVDGWCLSAVLLRCFGLRAGSIQEKSSQGILQSYNMWLDVNYSHRTLDLFCRTNKITSLVTLYFSQSWSPETF